MPPPPPPSLPPPLSPYPPTAIILLKAPFDPDLYTAHFPAPRYLPPIHIPPLTTTPLLSPLLSLLAPSPPPTTFSTKANTTNTTNTTNTKPPPNQYQFPYRALIFTSQRAVATLALALPLLSPPAQEQLARLRVPLFAVGPGTGRALREFLDRDDGGGMGRCWVEGEESGRGEALSGLVAERLGKDDTADGGGGDGSAAMDVTKTKKVLWLAGEKRREGLAVGLEKAGWEVETCVVYKTELDGGFPGRFRRGGEAAAAETRGGVRWVVIFSTQGAREVLRELGGDGDGDSEEDVEGGRVGGGGKQEEGQGQDGGLDQAGGRQTKTRRSRGRKTFLATIGPTTRDYLQAELGVLVDVCAERPSAEGLREGIERFMREKGIGRD